MSKVVYVGNQAGLIAPGDKRGRAGSMTNAADYELYCHCERDGKPTFLGPLARFTANAEGFRWAACPVCKDVTILNKDAQVVKVAPLAQVLQSINPAGAQ